MEITFCTISNNVNNIVNIISNHKEEIPLTILYYGNNEKDINNIIKEKKTNINIFYMPFFDDYASLWNNVFSRIYTNFIFWFYDTDVISEKTYHFFTSSKMTEILKNEIDIINIKINNNNDFYYEDRIVSKTLYPVWKERAMPRISYTAKNEKIYTIDDDCFDNIISQFNYYDKTSNLFNIMFENNEPFSLENLMLYTKLLIEKPNSEILSKILDSLKIYDDKYYPILNIIYYNIACAYYKAKNYTMSKQMLSVIDSKSILPKKYYLYLMGKIYYEHNLLNFALSCFEHFMDDELKPLTNIEKKYIYESNVMESNTMFAIVSIYNQNPKLYKEKTEE